MKEMDSDLANTSNAKLFSRLNFSDAFTCGLWRNSAVDSIRAWSVLPLNVLAAHIWANFTTFLIIF